MSEIFERQKVVSNGCSGACCESFTFAYYPEDLRLMDAAFQKGEEYFTDTLGNKRSVFSSVHNSTLMVADMLIPLGHTEINPNGNKPVLETVIEQKHRDEWVVEVDGKPQLRLFTCKHYDREKKVCGNYENRPALCKHFGTGCQYAGCTYDKLMQEMLQKQFNDPLATNEGYKL